MGLAPWHFYVEGAADSSPLRGYVDGLFVVLSTLFTCDRARLVVASSGSPRIRAEFRGSEHVAFVPVVQGAPLGDVSTEERKAVLNLLDWCYQTKGDDQGESDWLGDRLPFVQLKVAQTLEGRPEEDRLLAFVRSMPEICQGAKWHWRAFLEGRVSEYVDKVHELETIVADTVDKFGERTADLTKSLSDAMLAAIAALIGSFIAAAFASPFNATLFRIGMLTYAGYVAVFPGIVGIASSSAQVGETVRSFDARKSRFSDTLYPEKVIEIVADRVKNAIKRYKNWRFWIAIAYVAVTALTIVGAFWLPGQVTGSA